MKCQTAKSPKATGEDSSVLARSRKEDIDYGLTNSSDENAHEGQTELSGIEPVDVDED